MSDRAVSNTLGFVTIFAIVLFSLALVSTAGLQGLQDTRDATITQNAEQSMLNVANAIQDVHRNGESRRTASMRLGRGSLSVGEQQSMEVTVTDGGGTVGSVSGNIDPIVFKLDETRVVYEGTAVIRQQLEGASVVHQPSFVLDDSVGASIPIVKTKAPGRFSVGGSTAQVQLRRDGGDVRVFPGGPTYTVQITVTTAPGRTDAWQRALETEGMSSCSQPTTREVQCSIDIDGPVVVRSVTVDYTIS